MSGVAPSRVLAETRHGIAVACTAPARMGSAWEQYADTTPERRRTPAQQAIFGPPYSAARRLASAYAGRGLPAAPLQASAAFLESRSARSGPELRRYHLCALHTYRVNAIALHITYAALLILSWAGVGVWSAEVRWRCDAGSFAAVCGAGPRAKPTMGRRGKILYFCGTGGAPAPRADVARAYAHAQRHGYSSLLTLN